MKRRNSESIPWTTEQKDLLLKVCRERKNAYGNVNWKAIQADRNVWDVLSQGGRRNFASVSVKYRVLEGGERRGAKRRAPKAVTNGAAPARMVMTCPCCGSPVYMVPAAQGGVA